MAKVNFKYRLDVNQGYVPVVYKTKTITIDLPKEEHGYILFGTLSDMITDYIKNNLTTPDTIGYRLLNYCIR